MCVDKDAHHIQISPLCLHRCLQVMEYTVIHICYAIFTCVHFLILILLCAFSYPNFAVCIILCILSCNEENMDFYPTWDIGT
jgi:hypothetical protein